MPTTDRTTTGHGIPWTGRTWNPGVFGCTLAGPECTSCYAATTAHRGLGPYADYAGRITKRTAQGVTWTGAVFTDLARVALTAAQLPVKRRDLVFTTSMADLHHRDVPVDFLVAVYAEIAYRPHLTFQVLTKRPDLLAGYFTDDAFVRAVRRELDKRHPGAPWPGWPLPNVWPGTSMGDDHQLRHDRVQALVQAPAYAVRFLSVEPMIAAPNLRGYLEPHPLTRGVQALRAGRYPLRGLAGDSGGSPINLVILGGEAKRTKAAPRLFDVDGARAVIDYASRCGPGVHVQVKQLGTAYAQLHGLQDRDGCDPAEWPADLRPYYGVPGPLAAAAGLR